MTKYLNKTYNWQSAEIVAAYDDAPAWSALPGNLLIETIDYSPNKIIVDIGFGTGFPLLLLAEHFGETCQLYGVDLWDEAIERAKLKAKHRGIENINFLKTSADTIDLENESVDIVTSNLGINNFAQPKAVIAECYRLLKPNGSLYLATNLVGTFKEFYTVFNETLTSTNNADIGTKLQQHIESRATIENTELLFRSEGFKADKIIEKSYTLNYTNGTAFLNVYFIVMSFLPAWKALIESEKQHEFFKVLEDKLNQKAEKQGGLKLTVPYAVFKFSKQY